MKCSELRLFSTVPRSNLLQFASMQFYPTAPPPPPLSVSGQSRHPEYPLYHPATTSPRMSWNPAAIHHGWGYDFSQYAAGFNPADPNRSPPYHGHVTTPDSTGSGSGTPHNIRDILGAQQQATLQSEIAKTPSSYQQSPTSTAANVFSPEHAHAVGMRSPTTPNTPFSADAAAAAQSFYLPAMPRAGVHGEFVNSRALIRCFAKSTSHPHQQQSVTSLFASNQQWPKLCS